MSVNPIHITAINEALSETWRRQIPRVSFVPSDHGFAVVAGETVVFESELCGYGVIEDHYIGCIKNENAYWRGNRPELPNQRFLAVYRCGTPPWRFIDVAIQRGMGRIDVAWHVPLDFNQASV